MEHKQSQMDKLSNSPEFKSFMKKLALVAVGVAVVGFAMKLYGSIKGETLLITGMGTLSIVSFFLERIFPCPFHVGEAIWNFAMKLTGYSLAVTIMGVLFTIMHWSGSNTMLIIGLLCLLICAVAWLFYLQYYRKNRDIQIFEEQEKQDNIN